MYSPPVDDRLGFRLTVLKLHQAACIVLLYVCLLFLFLLADFLSTCKLIHPRCRDESKVSGNITALLVLF
jgi:hypothetical protein